MAAPAIAGRTPSRPTNPRRSIDVRFVSKIQVLVTWSAGTIRGCPITVEDMANAKPSNAVIVFMMDVSGSMGEEQKELVRLESFWIDTWLRKNYEGIESRYIVHDVSAKEVDKHTFYHLREDGGTKISSAYRAAKNRYRRRREMFAGSVNQDVEVSQDRLAKKAIADCNWYGSEMERMATTMLALLTALDRGRQSPAAVPPPVTWSATPPG